MLGSGTAETRRDRLRALADTEYDLLVVGGGSHGAFAAWEAALRGLRVALVERDDFASATSENSQHVVHGGFRYLRSLDVRRMRESSRERAILARAAPHLVRPLPVVLPTTRSVGARHPLVLRAALAVAGAILHADAVEVDPLRRTTPGRLLTRDRYRMLAGPLAVPDATGAALWSDGVMELPARLLLAVLTSAAAAGAVVLNHALAAQLVVRHGTATGVLLHDRTGELSTPLVVRARAVLDATGPWCGGLRPRDDRPATPVPPPPVARATAVLVRRHYGPAAAAVPDAVGRRMLFAVPWRDVLILGTAYRPGDLTRQPRHALAGDEIELLTAFNAALPALALGREEVAAVHAGFLPALAPSARGDVTLRERPVLRRGAHDVSNLVVMQGVKWTTARSLAERAVDLCERVLERTPSPPQTRDARVAGAEMEDLGSFFGGLSGAAREYGLAPDIARELALQHGTGWTTIARLAAGRPEWRLPLASGTRTIGAEVVHAVRNEMAVHLSDIALRRTTLAVTGWPGDEAVAAAARLASAELAWSADRERAETTALRERLAVPWAARDTGGSVEP